MDVHQAWGRESYAKNAVYSVDGTQSCSEFHIDSIFAGPQRIFIRVYHCWFDMQACIGEHVIQKIELLGRLLHRRIDEKDRCRVGRREMGKETERRDCAP